MIKSLLPHSSNHVQEKNIHIHLEVKCYLEDSFFLILLKEHIFIFGWVNYVDRVSESDRVDLVSVMCRSKWYVYLDGLIM